MPDTPHSIRLDTITTLGTRFFNRIEAHNYVSVILYNVPIMELVFNVVPCVQLMKDLVSETFCR